MPSKYETVRLLPVYDRRRKLTDADKERVLARRKDGLSQRALAKEFGVSRRLISFILDPDKHAENLKRRADRGGSAQYYDRKKNTTAQRSHRRYKKAIMDKGTD